MVRTICSCALVLASLGACDMTKFAVSTTSKVLVRAAPAMEMESDYEMAARAIPGNLKTVEGFHLADPDNERLTPLLAQGYCQYATGFIEDDFERAEIAGDLDQMEVHAERATRAYV